MMKTTAIRSGWVVLFFCVTLCKNGSTARYVQNLRTVAAYRTSVQFLKRTVPTDRTLFFFLRVVSSINLVDQRSMNDICDLC